MKKINKMCIVTISTINCINCKIPIAKNEIVRKTNRETDIHHKSILALKIKDNNIAKCKLCNEIIGVKINNIYTLFDEKIYTITFEHS